MLDAVWCYGNLGSLSKVAVAVEDRCVYTIWFISGGSMHGWHAYYITVTKLSTGCKSWLLSREEGCWSHCDYETEVRRAFICAAYYSCFRYSSPSAHDLRHVHGVNVLPKSQFGRNNQIYQEHFRQWAEMFHFGFLFLLGTGKYLSAYFGAFYNPSQNMFTLHQLHADTKFRRIQIPYFSSILWTRSNGVVNR